MLPGGQVNPSSRRSAGGAFTAALHAEGSASAAELPLLAPPTCDMIPKTDFFCYWPRSNKNHTGTWCTEIAQPRSRSADDCCQLCIKNSSASASAHAGTINCTAFAFNGKRCYLKAAATMNVTGHPIDSTDTSGRLVFKMDEDAGQKLVPPPAATCAGNPKPPGAGCGPPFSPGWGFTKRGGFPPTPWRHDHAGREEEGLFGAYFVGSWVGTPM